MGEKRREFRKYNGELAVEVVRARTKMRRDSQLDISTNIKRELWVRSSVLRF